MIIRKITIIPSQKEEAQWTEPMLQDRCEVQSDSKKRKTDSSTYEAFIANSAFLEACSLSIEERMQSSSVSTTQTEDKKFPSVRIGKSKIMTGNFIRSRLGHCQAAREKNQQMDAFTWEETSPSVMHLDYKSYEISDTAHQSTKQVCFRSLSSALT